MVSIQRRFLWGGTHDQNKIAWIKWESVYLPKEHGGLGIKDINTFNLALLGKWKWKMFQHQRELWVRVLESKYGGWRNLSELPRISSESIWWRDLKLLDQHPLHGLTIQSAISWQVGCGDQFRFWEDNWRGGEGTLLSKYPRLYAISCQQNQTIQQMGNFRQTRWEWDFKWRRSLFDNEIDMAVSFLGDIDQCRIQAQSRDQWVWLLEPSGHYSVNGAYRVLKGEITEEIQDRVFEDLWKLKVPNKILVFAWRLLKDRLPTRANLRRRQIEVVDNTCPFCRSVEENASHLFFRCSKVIPVWWESLSWVRLVGPLPNDPKQHFLQHVAAATEGIGATRWQWWLLALTWTIWKHRNNLIFSNHIFNANQMLDDAIFLLWTWLRNLEKDFATHYNIWSSNLSIGFYK